jgi:integrase
MASVQKHRNRWRVKWRDEHGNVIYDSFATEKEALKVKREVEARTVIDGKPPLVLDEGALTLTKWWHRWEPGRQWRKSSRDTHALHWRKYIEPVFGKVPIEQITTADVKRWHRKLEARGLASTTVASIHRTLSMALQGAVEDELIGRNPARAARLRRQPKTPPVALDRDAEAALLVAIDKTAPGISTYARLIAATGLRRAEAAGLTWDRIDLDAAELIIDRQLDYTATRQPSWGPTKTGETRHVPLNDATVALLKAHRAAQHVVAIKDALVFTRDDGSAWPRVTLADAWNRAKKVLDEAGTPLPAGARGWHTLRHTVGSRLLEAGIPPAEAAEILGHTPETLLATYTHVTDRKASHARIRAVLA